MLYYLGTAGGGVWKFDNGGATWAAAFSTKQRRSPAIGAVAIDPTNENVVWAGTGEANPRNNVSYGDGLYKTTDGGKHLDARRPRGRVEHLADRDRSEELRTTSSSAAFGDPFKDSTDRGVYVTFDGGKTWSEVALSQARRAARAISRWIR